VVVSLDPSLSIGSATAEAERLRRSRTDALALEAERKRRFATGGQLEDQQTPSQAVENDARSGGQGATAFGVAATPRFMAEPELMSAARFAAQLSAQDDAATATSDGLRRATADAAYRSAQGRGVSFVRQGPSLDLTV